MNPRISKCPGVLCCAGRIDGQIRCILHPVRSESPDQQFLRNLANEVALQGVRSRRSPQRISAGIGFRLFAACIDAVFFLVLLFGVFILALNIDDFDGPALHMSRANWLLLLIEMILAMFYLLSDALWDERRAKCWLV